MTELIAIFGLSFIAGITTSFQPCLFPLLPTYTSIMSNSDDNIKNSLINSIFLTTGIIIVFTSLAILVKIGFLGISNILFRYAVEFNLLMAIFLTILGVVMILGMSVPFTSKGQQLSAKILEKYGDSNYASFLLGIVYTLMAAPCAAPIFLALIPIISVIEPITAIFAMIFYSIGAGMPFLLVGIIMPEMRTNFTTKFRYLSKHMKTISGVVLLLMSYYLLNNYVLPYYPLKIGNIKFTGFADEIINGFYVIVLGGPLLIFLIILLIFYINMFIKKYQKSTSIQEN
ncbi:MAG: Thiol:disulfide interchange protein DsbD [Candidatus Heimdallarchaeota archaeon LC_3]|nr:MAG: Thiol:disulfide interchange protein DsbD [Candidatus Heimdallarchaeota archaeon LC_3]